MIWSVRDKKPIKLVENNRQICTDNNINIEAVTQGSTPSLVEFFIDDKLIRGEKTYPYFIGGDTPRAINRFDMTPYASKIITITVITYNDGKRSDVKSYKLKFCLDQLQI